MSLFFKEHLILLEELTVLKSVFASKRVGHFILRHSLNSWNTAKGRLQPKDCNEVI